MLAAMSASAWTNEVARLADNDELLTQDAILSGVKKRPGVRYVKRDFLLRGGVWRGSREPGLLSSGSPRVLVVGHSDLAFGKFAFGMLRASGSFHGTVWASNLTFNLPNVRPLPLGLTNDCDDSPAHRLFGNQNHFLDALEAKAGKNPALYVNFNPETSKKHRLPLFNLASTLPNAQVGEIKISQEGRIRYLKQMRESGLVLCPRGNGLDTHRIWEAFSVGAVPVLLKKHAPLYLDYFPAESYHVVDNWRDLTKVDPHLLLASKTSPPSSSARH
jgi:hypothetical protein